MNRFFVLQAQFTLLPESVSWAAAPFAHINALYSLLRSKINFGLLWQD